MFNVFGLGMVYLLIFVLLGKDYKVVVFWAIIVVMSLYANLPTNNLTLYVKMVHFGQFSFSVFNLANLILKFISISQIIINFKKKF